MNAIEIRHSHITLIAPFVLFAAYVSWLVVPVVVSEVVPEAVQAVIGR